MDDNTVVAGLCRCLPHLREMDLGGSKGISAARQAALAATAPLLKVVPPGERPRYCWGWEYDESWAAGDAGHARLWVAAACHSVWGQRRATVSGACVFSAWPHQRDCLPVAARLLRCCNGVASMRLHARSRLLLLTHARHRQAAQPTPLLSCCTSLVPPLISAPTSSASRSNTMRCPAACSCSMCDGRPQPSGAAPGDAALPQPLSAGSHCAVAAPGGSCSCCSPHCCCLSAPAL